MIWGPGMVTPTLYGDLHKHTNTHTHTSTQTHTHTQTRYTHPHAINTHTTRHDKMPDFYTTFTQECWGKQCSRQRCPDFAEAKGLAFSRLQQLPNVRPNCSHLGEVFVHSIVVFVSLQVLSRSNHTRIRQASGVMHTTSESPCRFSSY